MIRRSEPSGPTRYDTRRDAHGDLRNTKILLSGTETGDLERVKNTKILLTLSTSVFWSLTKFVGVDFLYEAVSFRQAGAAPALRGGRWSRNPAPNQP